MNTFKNYGELEELVVDWMDRQDIVDKVPTFVRLTTSELSKELRLPTMENKVVLTVYADGSVLIPNNLLEIISIDWVTENSGIIESRKPLNRGSVNKYSKSRENPTVGSIPDSFTRMENKIKVYPLPQSSDTVDDGASTNNTIAGYVELYYYTLPFTINEPTETNWILQVSPDIYFYGCLMHGYRYIRDMESAEYWQSKYNKAVKELQLSNDIADWAGGPIVVGNNNA